MYISLFVFRLTECVLRGMDSHMMMVMAMMMVILMLLLYVPDLCRVF